MKTLLKSENSYSSEIKNKTLKIQDSVYDEDNIKTYYDNNAQEVNC